jgi:Rieske Fe-S protein
MTQLNRREFVTAVACAACLCGLGGGVEVLADSPATAPSTGLDVGAKTDYAADGVTATWMKLPHRTAIIRHDGKIYASTMVCTHRGGTLNLSEPGADNFKCPRHGALFDVEGNVTKGPARMPLARYAILADANGHLIVDQTKQFGPDQWDDPASFVKV